MRKALVSYIFHEPISTIEGRLSLEDIDKYSDMALWMIENVMLAPFKKNK